MKKIEFFRTYSYGGEEGKTLEKRDFETEILARDDAIKDLHNTDFALYQITMIFDGKITEIKRYLGQIVCGKDLQKFEAKENIKKI